MRGRTAIKHAPKQTNNPIFWVVFLLQNIGRFTYKIILSLLKGCYLIYQNGKKLEVKFDHHFLPALSKHLLKKPYFFYLNLVEQICYFQTNFTHKIQQAFYLFLLQLFKFLYCQYFDWQIFYSKINKILNFKINLDFKPRKQTIQISKKNSYFPLILGFSSFLLFTLITATFFYLKILKDLPDPNQLLTRKQILTTKIYARDGSLLYEIYRNQNRSLIKLEDLPQDLIDATVAVEDENFWNHPGFSLKGIVRALGNNVNNEESIQGGSTITQQLVKNALLSPERTYIRKIKELILAIEVELIFDKKQILQMYFNEIPYGGVAYGAQAASQTYFGKNVQELTLAQAALLAGLTSAPTKYSPLGANPKLAIYRKNYVLDKMLKDKYISQEEYDKAKKEIIVVKPNVEEIKAPHFVMFVKDLLVEKYGTRLVEEGGLDVYTSLDPQIQQVAQKAVEDEIDKLIEMNVSNGAVLVTNPATGEILAMVGSRNYFDIQGQGNVNVTTQLRQPGSSIKPITYALALKSGLTPNSMIDDSPISFPDGAYKTYTPVNYDGKFHGNINLKTALASSFNIPAVKLLDKLGVNNMINLAENMGITSWKDRSRFGLSLTLGGGEVKMIDMAVVYGVFANQGMRVDLNPILKVKDANGKILQEFKCNASLNLLPEVEAKSQSKNNYCQAKPVLNPIIAYQISDMLSDNNARTPAFGAYSLLNIPEQQVAVKTGTTNDKRDNWAIGYTEKYVVLAWVGNNDNSPMSAVASGITGATPIWYNTMKTILEKNGEKAQFSIPEGMIAVQVCETNGLLPCSSCPKVVTQYFVPGTEPKYHCLDNEIKQN
ncbi:PBP1A family penicillin-binding protein [Candidatus Beckwithbacteria bacterium]|nr:PBP1A family penicillin-binding protein [Candidatus Beckwithbacteria bacterium]